MDGKAISFAASCLFHPEPLVQERSALVLTNMCRRSSSSYLFLLRYLPLESDA